MDIKDSMGHFLLMKVWYDRQKKVNNEFYYFQHCQSCLWQHFLKNITPIIKLLYHDMHRDEKNAMTKWFYMGTNIPFDISASRGWTFWQRTDFKYSFLHKLSDAFNINSVHPKIARENVNLCVLCDCIKTYNCTSTGSNPHYSSSWGTLALRAWCCHNWPTGSIFANWC